MKKKPLAYKLRPQKINEFFGQTHILSENTLLRKLIQKDSITSLIFYGPPGTGKSTLAYIIAKQTQAKIIYLNAVVSKVDDIRESVKKAQAHDGETILLIDEIHRFNKLQQDGLLPFVEDGTVVLIGITTENPFFYLNKALISRTNVFEFKSLQNDELKTILSRAKEKLKEEEIELIIEDDVEDILINMSAGDARKLLNFIEMFLNFREEKTCLIKKEDLKKFFAKDSLVYDRNSDEHYDTISAFIKSIRGSDANAAIYWLAKMLESGELPEFIARRLFILASEDVGNADPMALVVANAAFEACRVIGMPEARIILGQAVTYLASAPKSNASYLAINEAISDIHKGMVYKVPNHLRDSNYWSKTKLEHGKGYLYPHEYPYHYVPQKYWDGNKQYYRPGKLGFEKKIQERINFFSKLNKGESNESS